MSGIFREAAVERLSSPDRLEELAGVMRPADGIVTAIIAVTVGAALTWSLLGSVSTRVTGDGVLINAPARDAAGQIEAVLFIAPSRSGGLKPGMKVRVAPASVRREESGALVGTIASVSTSPASPQEMAALLHDDGLVKQYIEQGAPYQARVRLTPSATAFSGYQWSSGNGPRMRLSAGTRASGEIITRKEAPINVLVPLLRRFASTEF